jgi:hypothetical protein
VAGAIILPFQPSFAAILAIGVVPLIAYPYWREVRTFPSWWAGMSRALLILAVLAGAGLSCHRSHGSPAADRRNGSGGSRRLVVGLRRARNRTRARRGARCEPRAWLPHLERSVQRGVAIPRIGRALVLPHHPGSWGRVGGAAALVVGVGFGTAAWRGREREMTPSPDCSSSRDLPQGTATP